MHNWIPARGDKTNAKGRAYLMVIDPEGGVHELARRVDGVKAAAVHARMSEIDPASLPTVAEAKALQAERHKAQEPQQLTRMYRGIGNNVLPSQGGDALFFSTDPARAAAFGQLHYVDVTAAELARFERPHSERILREEPLAKNDWRTADPAIIARLRPLEAERHRAQEPAQKARQRPAPHAQERAAQAPEKRPLGKTAAQINAAWTESRSASDPAAAFRQAIEDRGPILVYVTAEEAYASERVAAFAREIGGTTPATAPGKDGPPVWMQQRGGIEALSEAHRESAERSYAAWIEDDPAKAKRHDLADYVAYVQRQWEKNQQTPGERQPPSRTFKEGFAVVDERGTVTRIDERTTGDKRAEIEQRLASIDRSQLLTVAEARDVMKEASRAAWAAQKQAERDADRPATKIEAKIIAAHQQAKGDRQAFDAALEKAGLGLARVTASDRTALDALRQDEVLTAVLNPAHKARYFPKIEGGELAAVDRFGGVHRINPHHVQEIDRQTAQPKPGSVARAEAPTKLPSVVELRAGFESDRDLREKFRQAVKDGYAKDRQAWMREQVTRTEERAANRTVREVVGKAERAAVLPVAGGGKAVNKVYGFVARGLSAVLRIRPLGILTAFDLGAGKPDSKEQAHQKAQAAGNVETRHARDYAAHVQTKEAEFDERMHAQKTADQQQDLTSSQRSGRPATREANLGRGRDDDYEREREI